ncbi:unnamed protein product [Dovyalis caffra]|uniref:Uncharacterized protein n=1 Tax=Dovyalis caffra TaxID=77055 RepID=A0AAV1RD87_9ROSI|nr:unnamed protein product [Dovyalis caffra]
MDFHADEAGYFIGALQNRKRCDFRNEEWVKCLCTGPDKNFSTPKQMYRHQESTANDDSSKRHKVVLHVSIGTEHISDENYP